MCSNPRQVAADLTAVVITSLTTLLSDTGLSNNPAAQTVVTELGNVETAIANWTPGTVAQDAVQIIGDVMTGLKALPIPAVFTEALSVVLAGLEGVLAVLTANGETPTPATADVTPEAATRAHQLEVILDTQQKIQVLVPGWRFHREVFHTYAGEYKAEFLRVRNACLIAAGRG